MGTFSMTEARGGVLGWEAVGVGGVLVDELGTDDVADPEGCAAPGSVPPPPHAVVEASSTAAAANILVERLLMAPPLSFLTSSGPPAGRAAQGRKTRRTNGPGRSGQHRPQWTRYRLQGRGQP
jgi:hypothetical protein